MPSKGLKPGDRVIDIGGLVQTAALFSGGVAGAWIVWLARRSWLASIGAFVAGALLGIAVAWVVARVLYRPRPGYTTVVRAGPRSLPFTIPASLAGGVSTAVVVALAASLVPGVGNLATTAGISLGCGIVGGILISCLSSLTWGATGADDQRGDS